MISYLCFLIAAESRNFIFDDIFIVALAKLASYISQVLHCSFLLIFIKDFLYGNALWQYILKSPFQGSFLQINDNRVVLSAIH